MIFGLSKWGSREEGKRSLDSWILGSSQNQGEVHDWWSRALAPEGVTVIYSATFCYCQYCFHHDHDHDDDNDDNAAC